jgi:hypothetical protein
MMGHADFRSFELFNQAGRPPLADDGTVLTGEALRQQMLLASPQVRAEYARTVSVAVDGYRLGVEFADNLIARSRRTSCPGGLWLIGDGGVGKTFIVDAIYQKYAPVETPEARYCPVLQLSFDSRPAESEILLSLLLQLGQDPATLHYQRNADLEKIVLEALPACQTLAILFDEANHLWLNTRAYRVVDRLGGRLGDFLKRFYDKSGLAFIFAGTSGLQRLLDEDTQASTRWSGRLKLAPFEYDDRFVGLLGALDEALPMHEPAGLATEALAPLLYASTKGNFRLLKGLLAEAVYFAAVDNAPRMTRAHLARAHFLLFCSDTSPFDGA